MKKYYLILIFLIIAQTIGAQCVKSIATGAGHSGYIDNDGTLWMWGRNLNGQLGNNTTTNSNVPIQVGNPGEWQSLGSFAFNHTYAIKSDGTLWQWGFHISPGASWPGVDAHIPTQVGTASDWKFVSAFEHVMAIKTDGSLWGWGYNYEGRVGNNSYTYVPEPVRIGTDNDWLSVATGGSFTAAIKTDGTLWAWGGNRYVMTIDKQKTPIQIGSDNDWRKIDGGNNFLVALKNDGTLWEWGMKGYSGPGGTSGIYLWPTQTNSDSDWADIDAALYKFYAIKEDGSFHYWGDGYAESSANDNNPAQPTLFGSDNDWEIASCGATHGMAIKTDGSVWTWGRNEMGDLGNGTYETSYIPILVKDCDIAIPEEPGQCGCECLFIQNPVHDFATVSAEGNVVFEDVTVYDISGKSIILSLENNQVYVGNLQQGIYLAEVKCKGKSYYKKFIKI
ncbi:T9SS type A sorting domain-containing protein [Flavobacterium sp.]|uniref:T9SS type A sorting domain-containing protein n=1 Tax=Flavobacterium sp. TaxID=239 RepID=UPI0039E4220B